MNERALIEYRVKQIKEWLLNGYTTSSILRKPAVKEWGCCKRTIESYVAKAYAEIKEINKISLKVNLAIITDRYWKTYRKAVKIKDVGEQTRILNAIAKIRGLDKIPPEEIDPDDDEEMSDEEVDDILDEEK